MYQLKIKQERFSEDKLTCQEVKRELGHSLNEESQRINVDSAKKRAVLQHMDYDGFRQMVLGANLKSIKAGSAQNIITTQYTQNVNFIASYNAIANIGYDEEIVRKTLSMALEDKLEAPTSQEDFERFFSKKLKDSMKRYTYLRLIDLDHYRKIFTNDFDSELLILIIQTFKEQVFSNDSFNTEDEQNFIYEFLEIIVNTPSFKFSLEFLGRKEKELIQNVLQQLINHQRRLFSVPKPASFFPSIPTGQKIKRFYKKVDIVEHPLQDQAPKLLPQDQVGFHNLSLSDKYWAVTLDGRPTKTMFKDNLFIPTKALAVALAEEWDSQKESINLKSLHINNFLAKSVRAQLDPAIQDYMKDELFSILESDQICFRESEDVQNDYKAGLAKTQKEHTSKVFDILEREFQIKLKIYHSLQIDSQDPSVHKLHQILQDLDQFAVSSIYAISQSCKSTAIALSFILRDELDIQDAVNIARVDENYQSKHFGKVEGAHDFDEAHTITTFSTAKNIVNLCLLREV
ncbi:atp12-domain-containing protein [Stylonychia lemnae]|uniref:Atp12-domain-containing protein n=1 Tax=Stylonychia lemnae TaxID=5949 RepID=A0A077ZZ86_STYLE|nr:atp12-domain-containing protein [Stylonychia lemnae]|eukprot:CDW74897.1 atp12-domain-containing protein [Stylonychia lemnae]